MSIFDWSKTASSNGNSDATINFQEGQAPSTVNDSARALMARIAYWRDWFTGNVTQGGSSNAYTITSGESLSAYTAGMRFLWKPNADSTGAVTLNVDAIGAKKVYLPIGTQAVSGSIDADAVYDVIYQTALDSSNGGFKIVGTGGAGDLLAANNLSDLASASTARTNLGLGTSAIVNTGTSGATIPLLNGTNTWSGTQTLSTTAPAYAFIDTDAATDTGRMRFSFDSGVFSLQSLTDAGAFGATAWRVLRTGTTIDEFEVNATVIDINGTADFSVAPTVGGSNTVWHAGNDGAGSGLDADTLDGVQGSGFAQLASANTFSAANPIILNSAAGTQRFFLLRSGGALRWAFGADSDAESGSNVGSSFLLYSYNDAGTFLGTALRVARGSLAATFGGALAATTIHARPLASSETSGTLTSASANKTIQLTGNPTINNSVFAAGDIIVMYAGSAARTITAGTITTMRLDGTATTGSRTLAARGMAMLFFVSATEVIVAGGAVT